MGNILIDNNGNALLSNNKALEVTSAIDSNIQPENIKKDVTILGVVGTYEGSGGGGSDAVILNPLNGSTLGTSATSGTVTYQYQISEDTISNCFLIVPVMSLISSIDDTNFPLRKYVSTILSISVFINNDGLITVNYDRSQSEVDEYPWEGNYTFGTCIVTNNGKFLYDTFSTLATYSCFIKGTLISINNKESKPVEDITYDDELLVWNFDDRKYDSAKPLWIKKMQKTNWYYKLTFSDNNILCVTGTYPEAHSLFSYEDGKFIHANKLVGKKVYTLNGIQTLIDCEEVHDNVEFYNVITDYHMNLFANNILTSTSLNNLYPIVNMKFIKERQTQNQKVDYSFLDKDMIYGLRLNEQPNDVSDYCKNLIKNKL